ncbi:MAG: hypothetical protein ACYDHC_05915 [Desulfuromonadaceae bacterium]
MKTQTPQTKKQTGKKARPKRPKVDYCTFVVEIFDWELPYSFSIHHDSKHYPSPYSEHLHLQVQGVIREPKMHGGKEIDLTFIGDRSIVPEINNLSSDSKPNRVGTINMRGEYRRFIGSIPFDSLLVIAPMLESKRLRFLELHGSILYRGEAATRSIRFFKDYDPEEW